MTNSLMQQRSLSISSILEHASRCFPNRTVVSAMPEGGIHRYQYRDLDHRSRRLAHSLQHWGVSPGDRVATLAWNTHRHLELFYAVSGMGAVLHTVNPRLFIEQIQYIINAGGATILFYDQGFASLVEELKPLCPELRRFVCMQTDYESLVAEGVDELVWPVFDENCASSMCFTSGTTGHPKGVVYSHRSTVLHALVAAHDNGFGLRNSDTVLPIAPMYHANAWAMPYIAPLVGANLVLPGDRMDPPSLVSLINDHQVTFAAAVPTIWKAVLDYLDAQETQIPSLSRTMIGGTAVPRSLLERYRDQYGVQVVQVWGMTETSPLGVACTESTELDSLPESKRQDILCEKQGRYQFGVDLRLVAENGEVVPNDGCSVGCLQVRGPWVASGYVGQSSGAALTVDGWFDTGDMATIDEYGYMKITDRSKDVIKSGGEWISSQDLENLALGIDGVAMAAAIAVPHEKWDERPVLLVVEKANATLNEQQVLRHFRGRVANWWIPDRVLMVSSLPMTATGKVDKKRLREQYADALIESAMVPR